jgi:mannosyltransferase
VAALAYRLGGRRPALIATAVFVVSLPLVAWQREARGYTLGMLFVAAAALGYLRLRETGTTLAGMSFVFLTELAGYTLIFSWWVFLAEASLLVLLRRSVAKRSRAALWLAVSAALALALPLALIATSRGAGQLSWLRRPGALGLLSGLRLVAGGDSGAVVLRYTVAGIALTGLSVVIWAAAGSRSAGAAPAAADGSERPLVVLCIAWIVAPIAGAWLVSVLWHPVFLDRYFLISLPAAAVLTAAGLERLWRRWPLGGIGAAGALLALHAVLLSSLYGP